MRRWPLRHARFAAQPANSRRIASPCAPTAGDGPSSTLSPAKICGSAGIDTVPGRRVYIHAPQLRTAGELTDRIHPAERDVRGSRRRRQTRKTESPENRADFRIEFATMCAGYSKKNPDRTRFAPAALVLAVAGQFDLGPHDAIVA
jgi:hypothetical protein